MNACIMCGAPCVGSACPHCKSGLARVEDARRLERKAWSCARSTRRLYREYLSLLADARTYKSGGLYKLADKRKEYETCVRSARSQYDKARTIRTRALLLGRWAEFWGSVE